MKWPIRILVSFIVLNQITPAPAQSLGTLERDQIGSQSGRLPFALHFSGPPPTSLAEAIERIYAALPPEQLDLISAFYGGVGFEAVKTRYPHVSAFYDDLRIDEILHRANAYWGFGEGNTPLFTRIECVGHRFSNQVALQIGMQHMIDQNEQHQAMESDRARAFMEAFLTSKRLFRICDNEAVARRVVRERTEIR